VTQPLEELAALFGVETSYEGQTGEPHEASPEAVTAALEALGVPVTDPRGAVRAERLRRHLQVVEPVVALPALGAQQAAVSLPRAVHPRDCWLTVETEGGVPRRSRLMPAIDRPLGSVNLEGHPVDRFEARLGSAADALPPGYHRLRVEGPGIEAAALVVVAPRCPVPRRGWGAFLPLYAARSKDDWGVGNYTGLRRFGEWVTQLGGELVGTLPLYPALLDSPVGAPDEISPYLPATRLGWNELYVDPAALPELEASAEARAVLESAAFQTDLAAVRRGALVDYEASMALVRRVLDPMSRVAFEKPAPRRDALEAFARSRPDMVAYARFRAGETLDPAAAGGAIPDSPAARAHLYAQWAAHEQLATSGDNLFLDLPVGVNPRGFDPLWEPDLFVHGVEGGAPPDAFFSRGQRWGFQPFHPERLRAQEYRHLIAVLRHAMARARALRLDHVMGLWRLYWVPQGGDATDGVYVRYPQRELRAVVALEAQRSGTAVVGEDLGTVPDGVRRGMTQDRMLRSWVLQFELAPGRPLPDPPELSVASIGTHDLPRFVAFWESPELAPWRRSLGGDARRALRSCLDHMAAGPARLVLVDVEDLWLERWPHNRPGTGAGAGNWRHRSARTLEDVFADDAVAAAFRRIDALRQQEDIA
jgi:4-alpha-glucanotransferase